LKTPLATPPGHCTLDDQNRIQALLDYKILDSDYEAAFDGIVKLASTLCHAPIAVINFVDQNRQWFKAETGLGVRETPLDISICRHAILEQDLLVINDTLRDPRTACNPLVNSAEKNLRFYAGALLKSGPYALGTLCVLDHEPRTLAPWQLDALRLLRDQVMHLMDLRRYSLTQRSVVQELDQARNELQRQAHIDALTGLLNRRAFENRLLFELQMPAGARTAGSLLMLDLDDFKSVNDGSGHLYGDHVLKQVAKALGKATRTTDVLGRWGGDEFLALLPGTDASSAREIAQRILDALRSELKSAELPAGLGASIGITSTAFYGSISEIIQAVDAAMYDAKRSGERNGQIKFVNPV
jgi:diguanylate cyclase (GGDEF)-like protein